MAGSAIASVPAARPFSIATKPSGKPFDREGLLKSVAASPYSSYHCGQAFPLNAGCEFPQHIRKKRDPDAHCRTNNAARIAAPAAIRYQPNGFNP